MSIEGKEESIFFQKLLSELITEKGLSISDISINEYIPIFNSIMGPNDMFDKTEFNIGGFKLSQSKIMKDSIIGESTNDRLYDFLYWLSDKNVMDKYLACRHSKVPKYDEFFTEINKKLYPTTEASFNYTKKCKTCGNITLHDYEGDECEVCKFIKAHQ